MVLIQECYEHGSNWAIVLYGNDTGVRLEVQDVLDQVHIKYIFYDNLTRTKCNLSCEPPTIEIMFDNSNFVPCISAQNNGSGLNRRVAYSKPSSSYDIHAHTFRRLSL
jgi:hypothetical protein